MATHAHCASEARSCDLATRRRRTVQGSINSWAIHRHACRERRRWRSACKITWTDIPAASCQKHSVTKTKKKVGRYAPFCESLHHRNTFMQHLSTFGSPNPGRKALERQETSIRPAIGVCMVIKYRKKSTRQHSQRVYAFLEAIRLIVWITCICTRES